MNNSLHPELDSDRLQEYLIPLMPEQLFEELRANISQVIAQRNIGGTRLTETQGKAIEGWLSDQVDILELAEGFYLGELERYVKGVALEDLFLRLTGK